MRRALLQILCLGLLGAATALALGADPGSGREAALAASAGGSFVNSRHGQPIFAASGLAPGDNIQGTVEISYDGEAPGALTLEQGEVVDEPGVGGAELSRRLTIRIADVTVPAAPATVYAGALAPMPPQQAGRLAPGETRVYEFVATLPDAAPAPSPGALRLAIMRVAHTVRHGRVLVWAQCDRSCRISARGLLRVRGGRSTSRAKLRPTQRPQLRRGTQRLSIRVPVRYRHRLAAGERVTARVVLRARAADGASDSARRRVRLRPPRNCVVARSQGRWSRCPPHAARKSAPNEAITAG